MAERDELVRGRLDERGRAADVHERLLDRRPRHVLEQPPVDPASVAVPALGLFASQGESDVDHVLRVEPRQLLAVDEIVRRPRRVEQPHGDGAADGTVVTEHRAQRHDARASADEEQRAAVGVLPHEVAPDRAAKLDLVAGPQLVDEIGRHLPVVEPFHGQHELLVLGRRRDGVAPLRLVAVFGRQPDVDVLAGTVARPRRRLEHDASNSRGLVDEGAHRRELPAQSPRYRCSRHGSP